MLMITDRIFVDPGVKVTSAVLLTEKLLLVTPKICGKIF